MQEVMGCLKRRVSFDMSYSKREGDCRTLHRRGAAAIQRLHITSAHSESY